MNDTSINFDEFPDLSKVKSAIKKFENINWPKYNLGDNIDQFVETTVKYFSDEIGVFPNILMPISPKHFTFKIFRARDINTIKNIDLFTEHSYPPPSITNLGRCNFPNHPVFYGSNNPVTAILEINRSGNFEGKRYCISTWKIVDSNENLMFETFLQTTLHPRNHFEKLAELQRKRINEPFEFKLAKEKELGVIEFMRYVDSLFINDEKYSISASLAHRRLYAKHNYCTDILVYPSVQTQLQGVNFAINPNFVDNNLRIQRFYIVEIANYDANTGKVNLTIHKYGHILKNVIFWENLKPNDELFSTFMREDFKDFISS